MHSPTAALAVALSVLVLAPAASAAPAAGAAAAIRVSFLLDPRLAGGTYGGERWVSPPTFSGASGQRSVEARAQAVDASGRPTKARVEWTPSDPELLTVSPLPGDRVRLTVKRSGECGLALKSGGAARQLTVRATQRGGAWQVSVSQ